MVMIPLNVSDELAEQLQPFQEQLPEIVELGLYQFLDQQKGHDRELLHRKARLWAVLAEMDGIRLPPLIRPKRKRQPPIVAGGPSASDMIIAERRARWENE